MSMEETRSNEKDRRRSWIVSFTVHAIILLLAVLPFLQYEVPPPGQQGVLVSFGAPDMGSGDDRPDTQQEEMVEPEPPSESEEEVVEPVEEVVEETSPPEEAIPEPQPEVQEDVVTKDEPDLVAIEKKKEEERQKALEEAERERKLEEARKKAQAEQEAREKAEAEAKKKAEYEKAKKQFGDSFGGGKGETDKPGNQGDPNGDPDASRLEGISTGSGVVGGGLGDRGVVYEPKIDDNSQKTGTVVVRVCVGRDGEVVSADYTQKGSTTADSELRAIAIRSARRFKFSKSTIDKQCGTITIDFRVR